jgi:hypothetical protein
VKLCSPAAARNAALAATIRFQSTALADLTDYSSQRAGDTLLVERNMAPRRDETRTVAFFRVTKKEIEHEHATYRRS